MSRTAGDPVARCDFLRWSSQIAIVFDAMGGYDIVEDSELDSLEYPSDIKAYFTDP